MKPSPFNYHRPTTLRDAQDVLRMTGGKVLAGGQSLIPLLSMRLAAPTDLVDIGAIEGLSQITISDSRIEVGALVRHVDLQHDLGVQRHLPLLARMIREIGNRSVRNRGTTVGSLCHADPAAEMGAAFALLDGEMVVDGPDGRRTIAQDDFVVAPLETTLGVGEIAVAGRFRVPRGDFATGYAFVSRRQGDFVVAGTAVLAERDAWGNVSGRAAYLGVMEGPATLDLTDALTSASSREEGVRAAGAWGRERIAGHDDVHGSVKYRRHLHDVLTRRALRQALDGLPAHRGEGSHGDQ